MTRDAVAGLVLCLLALPGARLFLEGSMTRHMLVQFPMLALIGFWFAGALPREWMRRLNSWKGYGFSGLFATALLQAILMIPRILDLALVDGRVELVKWLALLLCGVAVRLSLQPAGWLASR